MARTVSFENKNTLSACFVFQATVVKGYYKPPELRALFNHKQIMGNTMRSNCWWVGNNTSHSICQGAQGSWWARCYFGRTFGNIAARGFSCSMRQEQSVPFFECNSWVQDTEPLNWKRPPQTLCAAIPRITLKLSRPPPSRGLCNSLSPSTRETSPGHQQNPRRSWARLEERPTPVSTANTFTNGKVPNRSPWGESSSVHTVFECELPTSEGL